MDCEALCSVLTPLFSAVQGIARQRQAIVNGLRESVVQFSEQVNDISR